MKCALVATFALSLAWSGVIACSSSSDSSSGQSQYTCALGSQGCSCTSGKACDNGLTCVSDLCVQASADGGTAGQAGSSGSGGGSAGSGGGAAGTSGSGGSGGQAGGAGSSGAGGAAGQSGGAGTGGDGGGSSGSGGQGSVIAPLGTSCSSDSDCNGGLSGTGEVCGSSSKICLAGCHADSDCPGADTCDQSSNPWSCVATTQSNPIGTSIVGSYDPSAAIAYADAHWNDGKGECAEFVSDSAVTAGHLGIAYSTWVPTTFGYLTDEKVPFDEYTPSQTSVRSCPGDIVVYSNDADANFCIDSGGQENCGHIGLVVEGGSSVDSILADFHNNAHYHIAIGDILGGTSLGPNESAYSTLRIYHLVNCSFY